MIRQLACAAFQIISGWKTLKRRMDRKYAELRGAWRGESEARRENVHLPSTMSAFSMSPWQCTSPLSAPTASMWLVTMVTWGDESTTSAQDTRTLGSGLGGLISYYRFVCVCVCAVVCVYRPVHIGRTGRLLGSRGSGCPALPRPDPSHSHTGGDSR